MALTVVELRVSPSHEAERHGAEWRTELAALSAQFPTVEVRVLGDDGSRPETVPLSRWLDRSLGFEEFDGIVDRLARLGPVELVLRAHGPGVVAGAAEMLTRWQRLIGRTNEASATPAFARVIARLNQMHDVSKPLVLADWNHALDTWQWALRLDPAASQEAQLAALLHDVERLESEPDQRIEHLAPNYEEFKAAHATRGGAIARRVLESCDLEPFVVERVANLVQGHERPGEDRERATLNDADALSFFSQNSAGYFDYFGPAQTSRKIAYTLRRMTRAATALLGTVRIRSDVARILVRVREEAGRGISRPREGRS